MIRRMAIAAAAALVLSLAPGAAAQSADAGSTDRTWQADGTRAEHAKRWHVTGKWQGVREDSITNKQRVVLTLKKNKRGVVKGGATYRSSGEIVCRSYFKRIKIDRLHWHIFKETLWDGDPGTCDPGRTRMHRWNKGKLKVDWPEDEGVLKRVK